MRRSTDLDTKILADAGSISSNYAELVALATRQTFAGVETVVVDGTPMMFMKDIGNSQRISPVETLYASFPAFLYVKPEWGKYLLEPLLRFQIAFRPSSTYAVPDLGDSYPHLRATSPDSRREIEDTGSILIMTWAHAKYSGDKSLISQYYDILKAWTENLIPKTVAPSASSTSADGQQAANVTNLALKGIIGIRAMADISNALGKTGDAKKYLDVSSSYVKQWETLAGLPSLGHLTSSYGQTSSGGMMYNLYADKLLNTNLISERVYDAQSNYYSNQARHTFGQPFDTRFPTTAKSHWTLFTAGTTSSTTMRDFLVKMVYDKAGDRNTLGTFPTTYHISSGEVLSGNGSPAQGAMFALLALKLDSKIPGIVAEPSSRQRNTSMIVGIAVGAFAVVCLLLAAFVFWRRQKSKGAKDITLSASPQRFSEITPFTQGYDFDHSNSKGGGFLYSHEQGQNSSQFWSSSKDSPTATTSMLTSPASSVSRNLPIPPVNASNHAANYYHSSNNSSGHRSRPQTADTAPLLPLRPGGADPRQSLYPPESNRTPSLFSTGQEDDREEGEAHLLRADIATLRLELQNMRALRGYEPPPSYS
ncbi:hypothetical protein AAF712_009244 [Marasmius tenuissimus]|uniref:Glutaminase A central domain-containing protein n=1 Tax=Marasmius tenuissimus TaxID=585030 RepID=A0ABR2ZRK8_9AGAR